MNFKLVAIFVALAAQQVLVQSLTLSSSGEFFANDLCRKTVAIDAPVIDPRETLNLLEELYEIMPKNNNEYIDSETYKLDFNEADMVFDDNDEFGLYEEEVASLIDLSKVDSLIRCKAYTPSYFENIWNSTSLISTPDGGKPYGPNIKAFIDYYKQQSVEFCKTLLN